MASRFLSGAALLLLAAAPGCVPPENRAVVDYWPDASAKDSTVPKLVFDTGPPSCEAGPQGGVCGCLDLPLRGDPPNLYFVLDRSGSMTEYDKWDTVRLAVSHVMTDLGPRARFGAAVFPDPGGGDACTPGVEVAPLRLGDSPAGIQGPVARALIEATAIPASGGTPTAATIQSLTPRLAAFHGHTFAILATDGGPNCNPSISCGAADCIANIESAPSCTPTGPSCCGPSQYGAIDCLDVTATLDAIGALYALGVPTYVIGVPGSGPYASLLDQMAQAGGSARPTPPYYYPVDTTDQKAFYGALAKIAAKVTASCSLPLGMAPPDPKLMNVYFNGAVVPKAGPDGWTYANDTVTLLGHSCEQVLQGDVLDVRVVAGCPTIQK